MKTLRTFFMYALSCSVLHAAEDSLQLYLRSHFHYLASDALQGRETGEAGNRLAAEYIATQFKNIGLKPIGDNGTYFQNFEVVKEIQLDGNNSLTALISKKEKNYAVKTDFQPLSFSSNSSVSGTLIFAGYGINASDSVYNDYANCDVKDKIVLVLRFSPDGDNPHSSFAKYSALRNKTLQARERGAKALLIVTATADDSTDRLIKLKYDNSFSNSGIPVLTVNRAIVNEWLKGNKLTVDSLQQKIVRNKKPFSLELNSVRISLVTSLHEIRKPTSNVVGLLQVTDTTNTEHLVIGAHYDHLGYGGEGSGSLAPDKNEIHNGADDNASGTSGMIELARSLSTQQKLLKRNIVFIGFSGEEMGTLGSLYYTKHPILSLERSATMINLDMVGRLKEKTLTIQGTGTSSNWNNLLSKYNNDSSFVLKFIKDGFGPSDHAAFFGKNIPVLFFFTGLHEDYHKPSDDFEKINIAGEASLVRYIAQLAVEIDTTTVRPDFIKTQSPSQSSGDSRGYRVYVGTIPDYSEQTEGMKLSGVRENSPASKAGLQADDVLIKFGKFEIKNVYDYTYAIQDYKPGDVVEVIVVRGKEKITVKVTLEKRN